MIKKFLYFFNKDQKRSLVVLFFFMFVATVLEMLGLGFVFSIVGSIGSSNINNIFVNKLSIFFEIDKVEILSYLLIGFLIFYIIKIIFLIFTIGLRVIFYTHIKNIYLAKYLNNI